MSRPINFTSSTRFDVFAITALLLIVFWPDIAQTDTSRLDLNTKTRLENAIFIYENVDSSHYSDYGEPGVGYGINSVCYYNFFNDSFDDLYRIRAAAAYYFGASKSLANDGYPSYVWEETLWRYISAIASDLPNNNASSLFPNIEVSSRFNLLSQDDKEVLFSGRDELSVRFTFYIATLLDEYDQEMDRPINDNWPHSTDGADQSTIFCGGDAFFTFELSTDENVTELELMDRFQFLLCKYEGRIPFSSECAGKNFRFGQSADIGRYHYRVVWINGGIACGLSDFLQEGDRNPNNNHNNTHAKISFAPPPSNCKVN